MKKQQNCEFASAEFAQKLETKIKESKIAFNILKSTNIPDDPNKQFQLLSKITCVFIPLEQESKMFLKIIADIIKTKQTYTFEEFMKLTAILEGIWKSFLEDVFEPKNRKKLEQINKIFNRLEEIFFLQQQNENTLYAYAHLGHSRFCNPFCDSKHYNEHLNDLKNLTTALNKIIEFENSLKKQLRHHPHLTHPRIARIQYFILEVKIRLYGKLNDEVKLRQTLERMIAQFEEIEPNDSILTSYINACITSCEMIRHSKEELNNSYLDECDTMIAKARKALNIFDDKHSEEYIYRARRLDELEHSLATENNTNILLRSLNIIIDRHTVEQLRLEVYYSDVNTLADVVLVPTDPHASDEVTLRIPSTLFNVMKSDDKIIQFKLKLLELNKFVTSAYTSTIAKLQTTSREKICSVVTDATNQLLSSIKQGYFDRPQTIVFILNKLNHLPESTPMSEHESTFLKSMQRQSDPDWDRANTWFYEKQSDSFKRIMFDDWHASLYSQVLRKQISHNLVYIETEANKSTFSITRKYAYKYIAKINELRVAFKDILRERYNEYSSKLKEIKTPTVENAVLKITVPDHPQQHPIQRTNNLLRRAKNEINDEKTLQLANACKQLSSQLEQSIRDFDSIQLKISKLEKIDILNQEPEETIDLKLECSRLEMIDIHLQDLEKEFKRCAQQICDTHAKLESAHKNLTNALKLKLSQQKSQPSKGHRLFDSKTKPCQPSTETTALGSSP